MVTHFALKSFILQAESEKDSEEWLSAIENAIASSISKHYNFSFNVKKDPYCQQMTVFVCI